MTTAVKMSCAMISDVEWRTDARAFARAHARGPPIARVWVQGECVDDDGVEARVRDGTGTVRVVRRVRERALRFGAYVVVRGALANEGGERAIRDADVVPIEDEGVARSRADAWVAEVDELWNVVYAAGLGCE